MINNYSFGEPLGRFDQHSSLRGLLFFSAAIMLSVDLLKLVDGKLFIASQTQSIRIENKVILPFTKRSDNKYINVNIKLKKVKKMYENCLVLINFVYNK